MLCIKSKFSFAVYCFCFVVHCFSFAAFQCVRVGLRFLKHRTVVFGIAKVFLISKDNDIYSRLALCYTKTKPENNNNNNSKGEGITRQKHPSLGFPHICFTLFVLLSFFLHILKRIINQSINLLQPFLCDPFPFYVLRVTCL